MSFTESLEDLVARNRGGLLGMAAHWQRVPLGWVAGVVNGFPFPSTEFSKESGFPLLRIRDVLKDRTVAFVRGNVGPEYVVEPGDLVVGMDGDFNCALWRGPTAALNQRVCKVIPDDSFYDRRLLSLGLPAYLAAINEATSSITVKHLSSRTVSEIPLPLPPRSEQRRIVAAIEEHLSRLDAAVAGLKRVQALIPRYRAAVLNAAVEGKLGETDPPLTRRTGHIGKGATAWLQTLTSSQIGSGESASGWLKVPALSLATSADYGTSEKCDYAGKGPPVLRIPNVANGRIDLGDVKSARRPEGWPPAEALTPGDLLVIRTNGSLGLIGRAAVVTAGFEVPHYHASYLIRLRLLPDPILWAWANLWWNSPTAREALERMAATSAGQYNISLGKLKNLLIPVPPRVQAKSVIADVDSRLSLAQAVEREVDAGLARAARLRQSILKRAFEGKLVSQDPNDEPASALLERIRASRAADTGRPQRTRRRA